MPSSSRLTPLLAAALLLAACVRAPAAPPAPAPLPEPEPEAEGAPTSVSRSDAEYLRSRDLMVPVAGIAPDRIPDSFNDARSGARIHRATDILAPRGTPVLSADDGRVLRVSHNRRGGLVVYATDPEERLVYYYAHLDHWAKGLAQGTKLAKGDVIGYVGTSGNAPKNTPHLHFQVMRREPDRHYWEGTPLDVRPVLVENGQKR